MKNFSPDTVTFDRMIGGGQVIGTLESGKKLLAWGGLPGETCQVAITKKKSKLVEGNVIDVITASEQRIAPLDPKSYLSTSPWQIMTFDAEQHYKAALVEEAFEMYNIVLPNTIEVDSDAITTHYRNKVEFSWYGSVREHDGGETLDLAFFRRGSKGKIIIDSCSLLPDPMMNLALALRDLLARKKGITARNLKTLLIRCDQQGNCVWQLYVKDKLPNIITEHEAAQLPAQGGEVIYSDPRSPASRITERLSSFGDIVLTDTIRGIPFRYATEGFFQVNIPMYERALADMAEYIIPDTPVIDMYSGVGSIGLTIGGDNCTLIEINEHAVREMQENIAQLGSSATAVLAASEKATDHITSDATVIVDPPRAGLHADVVKVLLEKLPPRIIYLSCNPTTQARDVELLASGYGIKAHKGYNFFPRTPHIEHLVVLDRLA